MKMRTLVTVNMRKNRSWHKNRNTMLTSSKPEMNCAQTVVCVNITLIEHWIQMNNRISVIRHLSLFLCCRDFFGEQWVFFRLGLLWLSYLRELWRLVLLWPQSWGWEHGRWEARRWHQWGMYSGVIRWRVNGAWAPCHTLSPTNPWCSVRAVHASLVRSGSWGEPVQLLSTRHLWAGQHHGAPYWQIPGDSAAPVTCGTSRFVFGSWWKWFTAYRQLE